MKLKRLQQAREVLEDHLRRHDALNSTDQGAVLTNLAKVYWEQGDQQKSEQTLRRSLEADPNQDNGLGWFLSIQRERGEDVYLREMEWAASLPGSWRPQLWLAHSALNRGDVPSALDLYCEAIARAGKPVPEDLLIQISGDLGSRGYLRELTGIVEPLFDVKQHGVRVWNNLVKAHLDLGETKAALALLEDAKSVERLDYHPHVVFWTEAIRKAKATPVQ